MGLDSRYVASLDLENIFINKDTGLPLANGTIEFFKDNSRTTPKLVYQLTGAPPNYTYTALPDPVTLSSVGTPEDTNGDNIAIYYFPWDSDLPDAEIELYYVVVKDQDGVVQFTREAWPNYFGTSSTSDGSNTNYTNMLSNPQFTEVLFVPDETLTISIAGAGTTDIAIAPDWNLSITATGATLVTVARTPVAGSSQFPTNPPYTLDFSAGANISELKLYQRLTGNTDIWSPAAGASNGFIATNIVLAPGTAVTVKYEPSQATTGNPQTILIASNTLGDYTEYSATVQLLEAVNTDTSDDGYVDISIYLPIVGTSSITSIQVLGLNSNISNVLYNQVPTKRLTDQMFNYYLPLLEQKPISSYLVGWDFPLNPNQFSAATIGPVASGANKSFYTWDSTIFYQSVTSGGVITRSTIGNYVVTANAATQFALVQYIPRNLAIDILINRLSVNVAAISDALGGIVGTISLWYTTDVSLPSTASTNSLVLTLDANGKPATFNGSWSEITRSNLGDAKFLVEEGVDNAFNDYGFSGWDFTSNSALSTFTYMAIVVGFATLPITKKVQFNSISLVPGDIPTRPAPKTRSDVQIDCNYYYRKSFLPGTVPAQAVGLGTGELIAGQTVPENTNCVGPVVQFDYPMHSTPTVTLYNPFSANAQIRNEGGTPGNYSSTAAGGISVNGFSTQGVSNAGSDAGNAIGVHYSADARLGR